MNATRTPRRRRGAEEGSAAIEAAIILPILLLLVAGTIEFAFVYWVSNSMLLAVEAAGRNAMVNSAACAAGLLPSSSCTTSYAQENAITQAQNNLPALNGSSFNVSATTQTGTGTPSLTITVTYDVTFLGSVFMPGGGMTLTHQVTVPLT
jgi:Flp pilus assembly protein TadG